MEIVTGNKSNEINYVYENFIYIKSSSSRGLIYLKCKNNLCKATASLKENDFKLIKVHTHLANLSEIRVLKFRNELRKRAEKDISVDLFNIYLTVQQEFNDISQEINGYTSVHSMMRRARSKSMPPNPTNFLNFENLIALEKFKHISEECGPNKRDFYNGVFTATDGSKIIYFSSPAVLDYVILSGSCELGIDATFKIVPRMENLKLMLIVHVKFNGRKVSTYISIYN